VFITLLVIYLLCCPVSVPQTIGVTVPVCPVTAKVSTWQAPKFAAYKNMILYGVVRKWRHRVFDNFWHPLPPIVTLFSNKAFILLSQNPWYPIPPQTVTSFMDNPYVYVCRLLTGMNKIYREVGGQKQTIYLKQQ
jgi:hypothetical protein